ncbi:MAG: class I SAM-dependent methyltransferase [Actinomycetota bacterium]
MSGVVDRAAWLRRLRRENAEQEDALSAVYDERWGEIEDTHRRFIERFLSSLPAGARVLDAACGTGKYFGMVLESGRSLLAVDHSAGHLARAREKLPDVPTERRDLQELPYREEFDGVMCVDALEMIPPEDWPVVLDGFRRALRPGGRLYLTVERVPDEQVRRGGEDARRSGLPVVEGEVMWEDDLYHHYPSMDRVWGWLADAGFVVDEALEGPWDEEDDYAYHHVVAHAELG